jgi:cytochrome P450
MAGAETLDGLAPAPPRESYFDDKSGVWILSRYADVLAAFREPRLRPVDSDGKVPPNPRDETGTLIARHEVMDALSHAHVGAWQARIVPMAEGHLARVKAGDTVELLEEFAKPWCMSLALMVTGSNPADAELLGGLADRVLSGSVEPDLAAKVRAKEAVAEMDRYFANATVPMTQQTFIGVAQTLPRLLVNGWLALFQRPDEVARLRASPELMPRAVEELLRFAGLTPSLFRKASAAVDLGFAKLGAGDRVTLHIGSANRDPAQFPDPDRLDISRRETGQLSLGIGHASCAGSRLIRMAHSVGISTLLKFDRVEVAQSTRWTAGSGLNWPSSVHVTLGSRTA